MPLQANRRNTQAADPHQTRWEGVYGLFVWKTMIVRNAGGYNGHDCDADDVSAGAEVPDLEIQMNCNLPIRTESLSALKILVLGRSERPMLLLHWP
jgi:hypothetical protein